MLHADGTFAAIALADVGLVVVADRRRRVGTHVCDDVNKLHELTGRSPTIFFVAGLECATDEQNDEGTDPCRSFEEAEKCFDLRRVIRSVVRDRALSQGVVVELARAMVTEAAVLDRGTVRESEKPLASVVVASFEELAREATIAVIDMGAGSDGVVRATDLRPYLLSLSAGGLRSHSGAAVDPGTLCFGNVPHASQDAASDLEHVHELQRRLGAVTAGSFEGAVETLVGATARNPNSPIGGGIGSVVLGMTIMRRTT